MNDYDTEDPRPLAWWETVLVLCLVPVLLAIACIFRPKGKT